jgi:tetratricopeptide (TPR) repeat protein
MVRQRSQTAAIRARRTASGAKCRASSVHIRWVRCLRPAMSRRFSQGFLCLVLNQPPIDQSHPMSKDVRTLFSEATKHYAAGRLSEAIFVCNRILALDPNSAGACNNLSVVLTELGQIAEAQKFATKATDLAPRNGKYWYNLCVMKRFCLGDPIISSMETSRSMLNQTFSLSPLLQCNRSPLKSSWSPVGTRVRPFPG